MSAPAPELPRRTPGLAGNEFEQLAPLVEGQRACFECEREPAQFRIALIQTTHAGATVGQSFLIGAQCVGPVAADLPVDVDVIITRLTEETSHV